MRAKWNRIAPRNRYCPKSVIMYTKMMNAIYVWMGDDREFLDYHIGHSSPYGLIRQVIERVKRNFRSRGFAVTGRMHKYDKRGYVIVRYTMLSFDKTSQRIQYDSDDTEFTDADVSIDDVVEENSEDSEDDDNAEEVVVHVRPVVQQPRHIRLRFSSDSEESD